MGGAGRSLNLHDASISALPHKCVPWHALSSGSCNRLSADEGGLSEDGAVLLNLLVANLQLQLCFCPIL